MKQSFICAAGAILSALALSGCVDSSGPLLSDAQPVLGQQLRLQFYSLRKGTADEPEQATYKWDRGAYQRTGGGMTDISSFSVHPLARDTFVVQSAAAKRPGMFEYAVARRLVDGVYQVIAIDEADAGRVTRARFCKRASDFVLPHRKAQSAICLRARHRRAEKGSRRPCASPCGWRCRILALA